MEQTGKTPYSRPILLKQVEEFFAIKTNYMMKTLLEPFKLSD